MKQKPHADAVFLLSDAQKHPAASFCLRESALLNRHQDILLAAFRIPDAVRSLLHQEKALHSGSPLQSDYGDAASCLIFPPHLSDGQRSKNARSEILSTDDQQEKALFMTVL